MVKIIKAKNISQAWVKGCEVILNEGFWTRKKVKLHNLVVEIETLETEKLFEELFQNYMDMEVFKRTLQVVSSEKSLGSHPSYWRRLKGKEEFKIDQIAQAISRLKLQPHSTKLTLCIYTPKDFSRKYTPCILCAELRVIEHKLYLTAFIRSQDFAKKSYADYLGLVKIIQKISEKTNIPQGGIVAHIITASINRADVGKVKKVIELFKSNTNSS